MDPPAKRLPFPDPCPTLWIFPAMAIGLGLGDFSPTTLLIIAGLSVGTPSIAIGSIVMRYPPLANIRYEEPGNDFRDRTVPGTSFVRTKIAGPVLIPALAVLLLSGYPGSMCGPILVGLVDVALRLEQRWYADAPPRDLRHRPEGRANGICTACTARNRERKEIS